MRDVLVQDLLHELVVGDGSRPVQVELAEQEEQLLWGVCFFL